MYLTVYKMMVPSTIPVAPVEYDELLREDMQYNPSGRSLSDYHSMANAFYCLGAWSGRWGESRRVKKPLKEVADYCVFDTETSGLSKRDCAIQVAIGFFDANGKALGFYDRLWKLPDGVTVSYGSYKIHGISQKRVMEEGYDTCHELRAVSSIFKTMKRRNCKIVAHNALFDLRILSQTAQSFQLHDLFLPSARDVFCTMVSSRNICNMRSQKTGLVRAPKNSELYKYFFGEFPKGRLHDACEDVKVTSMCYIQGRMRQLWN